MLLSIICNTEKTDQNTCVGKDVKLIYILFIFDMCVFMLTLYSL
jgi:hypothetical protein